MTFSFMKKLAQMMPERNLKYRLHEHLNMFDEGRPIKTVHASELTKAEGFCPRAYALMDLLGVKSKGRWLSTSESVTFEVGRNAQDSVVNWFAEMGIAVVDWFCPSCNRTHMFQKRPLKCDKCGSRFFLPKEPRFVSAVSGASCGIDMLADVGKPKLLPVEIKTMAPDEFKKLIAPLAEHKQRTSLYLRIVRESDHSKSTLIDTSEARVLYVSKGGYGCADDDLALWGMKEKFSPFREFVVVPDDSLTDEPTRRAQVVKWFRSQEVGMPEGICDTAMCKRAKDCPVIGPCFSGSHPAEHQWRST